MAQEDYDEEDLRNKKETAKKAGKIQSLRNKGMSERDATIKGLSSKPEKAPKTDVIEESDPEESQGLRIRLENEDLDKLGLALPEVGSTIQITAKGLVENVASSQGRMDPDARRSIELQITDLQAIADEMEEAQEEEDDDAEEL